MADLGSLFKVDGLVAVISGGGTGSWSRKATYSTSVSHAVQVSD